MNEPMSSRRDALQVGVFESVVSSSEDCFRAFVTARCNAVYRMSADWKEMQLGEGPAIGAE